MTDHGKLRGLNRKKERKDKSTDGKHDERRNATKSKRGAPTSTRSPGGAGPGDSERERRGL